MPLLPEVVDDVLARFQQRLDKGMLPLTPAFFEGSLDDMPGFGLKQSEAALSFIKRFRPDRDHLIARLTEEFPDIGDEFEPKDVVTEIEEIAGEGLQNEMIRIGMTQESARQVSACITFSLLLAD